MPNRLKILSIPLFLLFLSGCTTIYNPATQKRETLLIDTQSEVALGRDMDKDAQRKLKMSRDPLLEGRLDKIGKAIASVSDRQDLTYTFRIAQDKELNAFAMPGGFIYVNTGLMDKASDDELACVLAHEIGHVAARHSVKRMQAALGYGIIMSIITGVSGQQEIGRATDLIFNIGSLGYSRQDELFSDKLAVKYAKKSGYDPYGMVSFFEKLKEEEKKRGGQRIPFLSSHPDLNQRIEKVKEEIALSAP